jgi:lipoprotein-releasing system permease protein
LNISLYIAKRYLYSPSKNKAINVISRIASLGIVVGAMALFVVLSVFSGLRDFSLTFINKSDPDLKIAAHAGKSFFINPKQETQIQAVEGVAHYSKIIEERVLFGFGDKQQVAYLKGIDANFNKVNAFDKNIFNGEWLESKSGQVVVGYGIAQKLSMGLLDFNTAFEVLVPKPGKGAIENPEDSFNKTTLLPVGIYNINEDLDLKYVFCDLGLMQELMQYKNNQISGIEIKLKPNADEEAVTKSITTIFHNKIVVKNRIQLNESLYKMLNTENTVLYLIFTLVIIIALFNLIGALIMMILEKKSNLRTLYNLGVEVKSLQKIFFYQGVLLSLLSGLLGLFLGMVMVLLQSHFQFIMITDALAYPVVFSIENMAIVFVTNLLLGSLAAFIASSQVTKKFLH